MTSGTEYLPDWLDVSRETFDRLSTFWGLVQKWNRAVNLVAPSTIEDGWRRHILDSAQIWACAGPFAGPWLDVGSGGGFPGLVVAIIAREFAPSRQVTLVESDRRKAVFLAEAARQCDVPVEIKVARIERMEGVGAAILSARAMAPLVDLLSIASRHLDPGGIALFPKGQNFEAEILAAQSVWRFDCNVIPSKTDPRSVVLRIGNISDV